MQVGGAGGGLWWRRHALRSACPRERRRLASSDLERLWAMGIPLWDYSWDSSGAEAEEHPVLGRADADCTAVGEAIDHHRDHRKDEPEDEEDQVLVERHESAVAQRL